MDTLRAQLLERFRQTRVNTEALAAPLSEEDQQLQSMPLASPTKWHRAHTTWFFETFLLQPAGVEPYDPRFGMLFNSYYDSIGDRVARHRRGLISRPTADEVAEYRSVVDARVARHLEALDHDALNAAIPLIELGLAHEEQHQELLLTDILSAFYENPLGPAYRDREGLQRSLSAPASTALRWTSLEGGIVELGAHPGRFCFDNELPRHRVVLQDYELADREVTVGEVKAFIAARGYDTPSLWLSQGYDTACVNGWRAPGYARVDGDGYAVFTLRGWRHPADDEPASHLSYWEADAIARFLGARLPTEAEWEHAAQDVSPNEGNFADGPLIPQVTTASNSRGYFGNVWQWTRSSYDPYPGYRAGSGALGEYNAKFMAQQLVLRGGSCLTPRGHVRASYRNFWHPDTRFQMTGVRLAKDRGGCG